MLVFVRESPPKCLTLQVYLEEHPMTDVSVVDNHGDHKSPKDRVVMFPFQTTMKMAYE